MSTTLEACFSRPTIWNCPFTFRRSSHRLASSSRSCSTSVATGLLRRAALVDRSHAPAVFLVSLQSLSYAKKLLPLSNQLLAVPWNLISIVCFRHKTKPICTHVPIHCHQPALSLSDHNTLVDPTDLVRHCAWMERSLTYGRVALPLVASGRNCT